MQQRNRLNNFFPVYFSFFSSIFLFLWIIDYTESLVTTNINVKTFTLNTGYQHHVHFVVGSFSAELSLLVFSWILKVLNSLSSSPSSPHNLPSSNSRLVAWSERGEQCQTSFVPRLVSRFTSRLTPLLQKLHDPPLKSSALVQCSHHIWGWQSGRD